ncbi:LytTR family DNA-binding domain-containing protein [Cellulophaga baltica]|uniref:LytR/AlgR family response regulator transcription factor n=1 Tax=Cellulophaga TaxID=104264 RepID=UPI001C07D642|nr:MULTISPECIES: LytTR family DNA-binding domain-containing protein [Cellulophaga]MBU2996063.1 LytTR family DNA-binding domain-containing protein [Cellulophaga baltica]MDO6767458.1 LytTR family DNA-binding domain-containing protein [Cellulophaga sp. 1_MG-2023]
MEYEYTIVNADTKSSYQLRTQLSNFKEFKCTGVTSNCTEGLNTILKQMPDIIFVFLNKKAKDTFNMVQELYQYIKHMPVIIGISKNKSHAYDAIKNSFFDYWLLPLNEFDIRKTTLKLNKLNNKEQLSNTTLCLKSYKDYRYLNTNDILYLKADNNTTDVIMKDNTIISAFKTLKAFESRLPINFIRIHQSYILNTDYIFRINYGKSICSLKISGTQIPFSKSYKSNIDELKRLLTKTTIKAFN